MNAQAMKERLEALEAENARLKAESDRPIKFKVAPKGGLSLYGLGRFPVTLYAEQWEKLLAHAEPIKDALKQYADLLKRKE